MCIQEHKSRPTENLSESDHNEKVSSECMHTDNICKNHSVLVCSALNIVKQRPDLLG